MGTLNTKYGRAYYRRFRNTVEVWIEDEPIMLPKGLIYDEDDFGFSNYELHEFAPPAYKVDVSKAKVDKQYTEYVISGDRYVKRTHTITFPLLEAV